MKKSLLLSIVMTLVLVVAMSTATFAWYTANSKVTADALTITASTAGSNVLISKENTPASFGEKIDLSELYTAETSAPKAPLAAVTTAGDQFVIAATDAATNTDKVTTPNTTAENITFYLKNDGAETAALTLTATPGGDLSDSIAWVLIVDGAGDANDAVLTNGYNIVSVTDSVATTGAPVSASAMTINIAKGDVVTCTLMVWIDGVEVANANQLEAATLALSFAKA